MTTHALIKELKREEQDFEFYPTTDEIIMVLLDDVNEETSWRRSEFCSFVDIGAGHGKVLDAVRDNMVRNWQTRAIERSDILIQKLVKNHIVIGTDFHELNLSTVLGGVVYCNPPYSEYSAWSSALIRHMPAKILYLLIPDRWQDDKDIADALDFSQSEAEILGSFTFLSSEDRPARCNVQLLRITSNLSNDDLMDKFLAERYPGFDKAEEYEKEKAFEEEQKRKSQIHELSRSVGRVNALVQAYNNEREQLIKHCDLIYSIDPGILLGLNVSLKVVRTTLTHKINSLRDQYWDELFKTLSSIKRRFTTKNLSTFSDRIKKMRTIEFTTKNIYAVVCWVLEQANEYTETQTLEVFNSLTQQASVQEYVSNLKVFGKDGDENNWRYGRKPDGLTHYKLDYRIILGTWNRGINRTDFGGHVYLSEAGAEQISDILTVLRSLNYDVDPADPRLTERPWQGSAYWEPKKPQEFYDSNGTLVLEVKAFLKGSLHLRFAPQAILDLNVAAGRYQGWIETAEEAVLELGDPAAADSFHKVTQSYLRIGDAEVSLAINYQSQEDVA